MCTHTPAHTHPQTHTHTHTPTHTHAHTDTCANKKHELCLPQTIRPRVQRIRRCCYGTLRALLEPIQLLSQLNSAPSSRASVQRCPRSAYMPACGSHQWVTCVCCETLGSLGFLHVLPWTRRVCAAKTWALEFRTYLRLRNARRQDPANSCPS